MSTSSAARPWPWGLGFLLPAAPGGLSRALGRGAAVAMLLGLNGFFGLALPGVPVRLGAALVLGLATGSLLLQLFSVLTAPPRLAPCFKGPIAPPRHEDTSGTGLVAGFAVVLFFLSATVLYGAPGPRHGTSSRAQASAQAAAGSPATTSEAAPLARPRP